MTRRLINLANSLDRAGLIGAANKIDSIIKKNANKNLAKITYNDGIVTDHTNKKIVGWSEISKIFVDVSSNLIKNWIQTDNFINAIENKVKKETPRGHKYVSHSDVFIENLIEKVTYPNLKLSIDLKRDPGDLATYYPTHNHIVIWMQVFARTNGIDSVKYLTSTMMHEVTHAIQIMIKDLKIGEYVPYRFWNKRKKPVDAKMNADMSEVFSNEINLIIDRSAINDYNKFIEKKISKSSDHREYIENEIKKDPNSYKGTWEEKKSSSFEDIHIHQQLSKLKLIIKDTSNNINSYVDFCSLTFDDVEFPSKLKEISDLLYILKCDDDSQRIFNEDIATDDFFTETNEEPGMLGEDPATHGAQMTATARQREYRRLRLRSIFNNDNHN